MSFQQCNVQAPGGNPLSIMASADPIIDPVTPPRRGYRRYWDTYNRPYSGCGCLWIIIIVAFILWIISWGGGYHWWGVGGPR
jgi:hypothetical protein